MLPPPPSVLTAPAPLPTEYDTVPPGVTEKDGTSTNPPAPPPPAVPEPPPPPPRKPTDIDLRNPVNKALGDKPLYEIPVENYTDVMVDKDGILWGTGKNGATVIIARKPPETVRGRDGKKIPNPEYQQYLDLFEKFGLK